VGVWGVTRDLTVEPVDRIKSEGGKAIALDGDVSDPTQVEKAITAFVTETGRLDVVVAAAGIYSSGTVPSVSVADWNQMIAVNLSGMFYTMTYTIPHLLKTKGNFVAIGSGAGLRGAMGTLAYTASKHGVTGLVKSLALDFGPQGVRVNQICPGPVQTPMAERGLAGLSEAALFELYRRVPVGRFGRPEEIAKAAAYLCSDDAAYINGESLVMDGGGSAGAFTPRPLETA